MLIDKYCCGSLRISTVAYLVVLFLFVNEAIRNGMIVLIFLMGCRIS